MTFTQTLFSYLISVLFLGMYSCTPLPNYDIVIQGGQLIDGLGNARVDGNIGIVNGQQFIFQKGKKFEAREIINASGLIVTPGFIDVHSHTPELLIDPEKNSNACFITQGVTTVVGGPDGFWSLRDYKMYQDSINRIGSSTNVAGYIGHNGVRRSVMGDHQQRNPTADELERMKADVASAMRLGAVGLSTGLMYPPGMFSTTDEVIALAKIAATHDGIYDSHIRNPVQDFLGSITELIQISHEAAIPAKMGHLKAVGLKNKGKTTELISLVEQELDNGLQLVSDQYPYDGAGGHLTLRSVVIPSGDPIVNARLGRNPMADLRPFLENPSHKKSAQHFTENGINNGFSWIKAVGYDGLRIVDSPDYPNLVGQFISEIAQERGLHPFDVMADLIVNSSQPVQVKGGIDEKDVKHLLVQPWNMVASDGFIVAEEDPKIGHPRSTGTFTKVLGEYVRDEGLLTLEEAIRKMTSFPADFIGLPSRGRLSDGLPADIVIFDANNVQALSTYTDPNKYSKGIIHLIVGGQFVIKNEIITTNRPGRFLIREDK